MDSKGTAHNCNFLESLDKIGELLSEHGELVNKDEQARGWRVPLAPGSGHRLVEFLFSIPRSE
jgi:hypothetical protein